MPPIEDHPLRYRLANELHARPFPSMKAPSTAAYLAIKRPEGAAARDREADMLHLLALLDRHGAPHPQPGATHYFGRIGRHMLKWESHTEFVTYTAFTEGVSARPFDPRDFEVFPDDWLGEAPGVRMTSALIRITPWKDKESTCQEIADWFVPESVAVARVLDDAAVVAGDFRIDPAGHLRFSVTISPQTGQRRIGRVVQRLCEIETYKAMSMLGFSRAGELSARMGELDGQLTKMIGDMTGAATRAEDTLKSLLSISAELESMVAQSSFRFGATGAYEHIVHQRIAVLREQRFEGRQTFSEFMMRRYDPAMRTVKSSQDRLNAMADRAMRAGELLRTRVDVERSAQNQALLESMDQRADMQLRLQKTVEGLSVVAISYYAVSLAAYLLYPLAQPLGLSKEMLTAGATPVVVLLVWWMIHRIRKRML
ncbi:hypothetical protein RAZWK3B_08149 [Roseobacter sp. AzwK-3b]|uniref:Uncharacterized membrane-anchored protein n=1 Tax=Roseovarius litoreus TaxID=1155722 RepID=A0A1M7FL36_9RHOB|nr:MULTISPECIES: DUF3422 domain-containing protein [Roseobacteraceae]EDM69767.1 hypothetical protein RAZWK3B_08149 [Roseobacter sp. AzwK-3b]SHM04781.1 Uncharacterized membrane-anchored protein [Roseovarius litoreus]